MSNISKLVSAGAELEVDLIKGNVCIEGNIISTIEPFSDYVLSILTSGGIKPMIKKELEEKNNKD